MRMVPLGASLPWDGRCRMPCSLLGPGGSESVSWSQFLQASRPLFLPAGVGADSRSWEPEGIRLMFLPHSAPQPAASTPGTWGTNWGSREWVGGRMGGKAVPQSRHPAHWGREGLVVPQARAPAGPPHRERHSQAKGAGGLRFSPTRSGGPRGPIKL